jgi:hypothetical protein
MPEIDEQDFEEKRRQMEELIRQLEDFEGKIREQMGASAGEVLSTDLLSKIRNDFSKFSQQFAFQLSQQLNREMTALFSGGNLPGFGRAGEQAGGALGAAVGAAFGAWVGGPQGAQLGAAMGKAAGEVFGGTIQMFTEGFEMLGARRLPQIFAGQMPQGLDTDEMELQGAEYMGHLAKLQRETELTAEQLDSAMVSASRLGVAQNEEGRTLSATLSNMEKHLNLQQGMAQQLGSRMVKEYGQDLSDAKGELADIQAYQSEWNQALLTSESATARAFISAQTLTEALDQVAAGARTSGATLSDLRASAQSLLLMMGEMGRPEITRQRAAQLMQAITPEAMQTSPLGDIGASKFQVMMLNNSQTGRDYLERLYSAAKTREQWKGLDQGALTNATNQILVQANVESEKGQAFFEGYDPKMMMGLVTIGMMEMAKNISSDPTVAGHGLRELIGQTTGVNVAPSAFTALIQDYRGRGQGDFLEFFMREGKDRLSEEAARASGIDAEGLAQSAKSRAQETVGMWKTVTTHLTGWMAQLSQAWTRQKQLWDTVGPIEEVETLAMLGAGGGGGAGVVAAGQTTVESELAENVAQNAEVVSQVLQSFPGQGGAGGSGSVAPWENRPTEQATWSTGRPTGGVQYSQNFMAEDLEIARGQEAIRRSGASPTGSDGSGN